MAVSVRKGFENSVSGPSAKTELVAAPTSVGMLDIQKILEGRSLTLKAYPNIDNGDVYVLACQHLLVMKNENKI